MISTFVAVFTVVFLWLCVGHALADFPFQGEYLAQTKDANHPVGQHIWKYSMVAHVSIHGGMVCFISGSLLLGIVEACIHAVVDSLKCKKRISYATDQRIHYSCKLLYAILVAWGYPRFIHPFHFPVF